MKLRLVMMVAVLKIAGKAQLIIFKKQLHYWNPSYLRKI
jgi:hypothetical protein